MVWHQAHELLAHCRVEILETLLLVTFGQFFVHFLSKFVMFRQSITFIGHIYLSVHRTLYHRSLFLRRLARGAKNMWFAYWVLRFRNYHFNFLLVFFNWWGLWPVCCQRIGRWNFFFQVQHNVQILFLNLVVISLSLLRLSHFPDKLNVRISSFLSLKLFFGPITRKLGLFYIFLFFKHIFAVERVILVQL